MSCDNRCDDPEDKMYGWDNCMKCPGRDDGEGSKFLLEILYELWRVVKPLKEAQ